MAARFGARLKAANARYDRELQRIKANPNLWAAFTSGTPSS